MSNASKLVENALATAAGDSENFKVGDKVIATIKDAPPAPPRQPPNNPNATIATVNGNILDVEFESDPGELYRVVRGEDGILRHDGMEVIIQPRA